MTKAERNANRQNWEERVAAFKTSNKGVREWCRLHGIHERSMHYWLKKFREEGTPSISNWMSVDLKIDRPAKLKEGLVIRVGQAWIEVQPDFNPGLLSGVVRILSELC